MTVEELSQYRSLKWEIEELTEEVRRLECTDVVSGSDNEFPYIQHNIKVQGADSALLELEEMKRQLKKCRREYWKLNRFINSISDSETRRIFRLRYVEGLSWQAVAMRIGEFDESYPRRKHKKYLINQNLPNLPNLP